MKVLILAYDFPPLISVGGQRPYSWYKYLPASGISVTVITRQWPAQISSKTDYVKKMDASDEAEKSEGGSSIVRAGFNPNLRDKLLIRFGLEHFALIRKLLSFFYSFFEHLFFLFDSKASIFYRAEKEIQKNRPDVIIATGEPFILFKYAHHLSKQHNIPWIADYRDTWTGNQGNYTSGPLKNLLSWFYRNREQKYTASALLITTAAPAYAASLKKTHPGKEIEVIYNGYDDVHFENLDAIQPPAHKFIIAYAGTIYPHQNLEMFLDGLHRFINRYNLKKGDVEAHFHGIDLIAESRQRLFNYNKDLEGYLIEDGRIPYPQLMQKLRASHVLLLLSKSGADWLNVKIFDYLAVKRKVFLVENDHGILESLLKETNGGVSLSSTDEVVAFLKNEYDNFKAGSIKDVPVNQNLLKYSRKKQADALAALLQAKLQGK